MQGLYTILVLYRNLKSSGGWVGKTAMADATETIACLIDHITYTQAPAVCEKSSFTYFVSVSHFC